MGKLILAWLHCSTSLCSVLGSLVNQTRSKLNSILCVLNSLAWGYDDSVVLAWTEKVRHDLVRPTTVIQRWGNDTLLTYGGDPSVMEPVEIAARDFQAHTRVMPHSEFPSGSSCMCTVFREFTDGFTEAMYGGNLQNIVFGGDDGHRINCDNEIGEDLPKGGCDHRFSLADMKELEEVCGQSRLWGGMHFTKSVPGGHELCTGIGEKTLDYMLEIMAGTDFGGNEYFYGDERPTCSDPSKDMTGPPPGFDEDANPISSATFVGSVGVASTFFAFLLALYY